jgi:hypothetical protein
MKVSQFQSKFWACPFYIQPKFLKKICYEVNVYCEIKDFPVESPTMITIKSSLRPNVKPTNIPSYAPMVISTNKPIYPATKQPTLKPSKLPSSHPSLVPTWIPSCRPLYLPTSQPTSQPSNHPVKFHSAVKETKPLSTAAEVFFIITLILLLVGLIAYLFRSRLGFTKKYIKFISLISKYSQDDADDETTTNYIQPPTKDKSKRSDKNYELLSTTVIDELTSPIHESNYYPLNPIDPSTKTNSKILSETLSESQISEVKHHQAYRMEKSDLNDDSLVLVTEVVDNPLHNIVLDQPNRFIQQNFNNTGIKTSIDTVTSSTKVLNNVVVEIEDQKLTKASQNIASPQLEKETTETSPLAVVDSREENREKSLNLSYLDDKILKLPSLSSSEILQTYENTSEGSNRSIEMNIRTVNDVEVDSIERLVSEHRISPIASSSVDCHESNRSFPVHEQSNLIPLSSEAIDNDHNVEKENNLDIQPTTSPSLNNYTTTCVDISEQFYEDTSYIVSKNENPKIISSEHDVTNVDDIKPANNIWSEIFQLNGDNPKKDEVNRNEKVQSTSLQMGSVPSPLRPFQSSPIRSINTSPTRRLSTIIGTSELDKADGRFASPSRGQHSSAFDSITISKAIISNTVESLVNQQRDKTPTRLPRSKTPTQNLDSVKAPSPERKKSILMTENVSTEIIQEESDKSESFSDKSMNLSSGKSLQSGDGETTPIRQTTSSSHKTPNSSRSKPPPIIIHKTYKPTSLHDTFSSRARNDHSFDSREDDDRSTHSDRTHSSSNSSSRKTSPKKSIVDYERVRWPEVCYNNISYVHHSFIANLF